MSDILFASLILNQLSMEIERMIEKLNQIVCKEGMILNKIEDKFTCEEKMEKLREKLNNSFAENIRHCNREEYESILNISKKLDDAIVDYIKSFDE